MNRTSMMEGKTDLSITKIDKYNFFKLIFSFRKIMLC